MVSWSPQKHLTDYLGLRWLQGQLWNCQIRPKGQKCEEKYYWFTLTKKGTNQRQKSKENFCCK